MCVLMLSQQKSADAQYITRCWPPQELDPVRSPPYVRPCVQSFVRPTFERDWRQFLWNVSKLHIVCVNNLQNKEPINQSLHEKKNWNGWILTFTDINEDSKNGKSSRILQSCGEV